jgi:hypothetical protein
LNEIRLEEEKLNVENFDYYQYLINHEEPLIENGQNN